MLPKFFAPLLVGGAFLVQTAIAGPAEEGAYLTAAAGCQACHTAKGGAPFAGGRALKTPFGTFFSPNITPDAKTGIGRWSKADFRTALKQGLNPEGDHYFPAFPYTSYTRMSPDDMGKIYAYLQALPAVNQPNKEHDVGAPFSWRFLQAGWKILFFDEADAVQKTPKAGPERGKYLVDALGHCGECHTPRNSLGGLDKSLYLAGAAGGGEGELVSNITPDKETGIGDWTKLDIASFLETGMKPNFDDVQGSMEEVISHGTSKLTKEDREAMADYLLSIPAIHNKIEKQQD